MTQPHVGSVDAFCTNGDLLPALADVTEFTQNGADGVGLIVGPKHQPISEVESTHFVANRDAADALKAEARDLVGTAQTVLLDIDGTAVANCFIKSVKCTESVAVTGIPAAFWKVKLNWEIYTPIDWAP